MQVRCRWWNAMRITDSANNVEGIDVNDEGIRCDESIVDEGNCSFKEWRETSFNEWRRFGSNRRWAKNVWIGASTMNRERELKFFCLKGIFFVWKKEWAYVTEIESFFLGHPHVCLGPHNYKIGLANTSGLNYKTF